MGDHSRCFKCHIIITFPFIIDNRRGVINNPVFNAFFGDQGAG